MWIKSFSIVRSVQIVERDGIQRIPLKVLPEKVSQEKREKQGRLLQEEL